MRYDIRITERAKSDMREIQRFITNEYGNSDAAFRRVSLIQSKIKTLNENPERRPLTRDDYLVSRGIRTLVVKNQIIFYIVKNNIKTVYIIRILHVRRDWLTILKSEVDNLLEEE
ncbi:MAG: type II toxin-antitoxin system RelE/ParE family toxin [Oscillospiraceae bacterium]|nr:type II toxin-antitoxin system RelE/ParE family toxin [Oscillospiraceae bacterium]